MRALRIVTILFCAAAGTGLAACGSSDDDGGSTSTPASTPAASTPATASTATPAAGGGAATDKADFVAKGDALCQKARTAVEALTAPTDLKTLGTYLAEAENVAEPFLREFAALGAPDADAQAIQDGWVKSLAELKATNQKALETADAKGFDAGVGIVTDSPTPDSDANDKLMIAYGFKVCNQD